MYINKKSENRAVTGINFQISILNFACFVLINLIFAAE